MITRSLIRRRWQSFQLGGRITVAKLLVELLEVEAGDVVNVTLYAEKPREEEEG